MNKHPNPNTKARLTRRSKRTLERDSVLLYTRNSLVGNDSLAIFENRSNVHFFPCDGRLSRERGLKGDRGFPKYNETIIPFLSR